MNQWDPKANEVFASAMEIELEQERQQYLDSACQGDPQLLQQVRSLIAASNQAGSFLEYSSETKTESVREHVGTKIGPYKLREKIGEGGFGVVYVAEQKEPVSRKVALKVIKPGMDSQDIIARFEAERQALAMMDHPNVAKVLDAGSTKSGRPYFVMELVHGVAITEYCDSRKLTNPQRLELFIDVCHAVQHAHQKAIIHRDIKPSNIMVTMADRRPIVKVIDFGVAKALYHHLTDKSVYTGYGQMIGTPMYMSPEQAQLSSLDIDTRSDIYSLGVVLYELLTGTTPFDKETFKKAGFDELRRMIREAEPRRPSEQVSTFKAEQISTISDCRNIDQGTLSKALRGDLDWIVMKTLDKDRARRYETARDLAVDIKRYLDDQPVAACPPSMVYRFRKFAWRNKIGLAFASLVIFFLITASIGLAISNFMLTLQQKKTVAALEESEENLRLAEASQRLAEIRMSELVKGKRILASIFKDLDIREVKEVSERIELTLARRLKIAANDLAETSIGDPLLIAEMQNALGSSLQSLGFAADALPLYRQSLDTRLDGLGPLNPLSLESMASLGKCYIDIGQLDKARSVLERALELANESLGSDDPVRLKVMMNLASYYKSIRQLDMALPILEELLPLTIARLGADHVATAVAMSNLASVYLSTGQPQKALTLLERAFEIRNSALPDHPDTLNVMHTLGRAYLNSGRLDEAIGTLEKVVELKKSKLGPNHRHTLTSMEVLATAYARANRLIDAKKLRGATLEIMEATLDPDHPEVLRTMANQAALYWRMKRFGESIPLYEKLVVVYKDKFGLDSPFTIKIIANLGRNYKDAGRLRDAVASFEEILPAVQSDPSVRWIVPHLFDSYLSLEEDDKAGTLIAAELANAREQLPEDSPEFAKLLAIFGMQLLHADAMHADAEKILRECLSIRRKTEPDSWTTFNTMAMLGGALLSQKKYSDAESLLVDGYQGMKARKQTVPPNGIVRLTEALDRLIDLFEAIDQPYKVKEYKAERALHLAKDEQPEPED